MRSLLAWVHCDLGYFSFCFLFYYAPRRKVERHINLPMSTRSFVRLSSSNKRCLTNTMLGLHFWGQGRFQHTLELNSACNINKKHKLSRAFYRIYKNKNKTHKYINIKTIQSACNYKTKTYHAGKKQKGGCKRNQNSWSQTFEFKNVFCLYYMPNWNKVLLN
jgi:hypothetical protein